MINTPSSGRQPGQRVSGHRSAGTASDAGGGVVAGVEVSTDGGTTWHPATGTTNWTYTWIVNTGSRDDDQVPGHRRQRQPGEPRPGPSRSTVSVRARSSVRRRRSSPTAATRRAVELGVKFTADTSGFVTGVRFYKSAPNTGTHTGSLWSSTGTLLATANFTNETSSGWQQVTFSSPVAVTAGTTYVASYHTTTGHYAATSDYFYGVTARRWTSLDRQSAVARAVESGRRVATVCTRTSGRSRT